MDLYGHKRRIKPFGIEIDKLFENNISSLKNHYRRDKGRPGRNLNYFLGNNALFIWSNFYTNFLQNFLHQFFTKCFTPIFYKIFYNNFLQHFLHQFLHTFFTPIFLHTFLHQFFTTIFTRIFDFFHQFLSNNCFLNFKFWW